jgi:hypothetical protein
MAVSASNSNSYLAQVDPYVPTTSYDASMAPQTETTPAAAPVEQPGKDEVGWLFVEQYYTTLNKTPEKLHVSIASNHCLVLRVFVVSDANNVYLALL